MKVWVCYSPRAREVIELGLTVPPGCTAQQALAQSGLLAQQPGLAEQALQLGVWGRKCSAQRVLEDGDRLEIYRPLLVDPKVARRERFQKQGARGTGLFARRRPGFKPGY